MLVQFVRDVMCGEVFILSSGDEDYVEVEAGTIGEIVGSKEWHDGVSSELVEVDGNGGYIYPEDSYTEANSL